MSERTHWADEVAREVLEVRPGPQVLSTGISPSGPIHVGNLREILTADARPRPPRRAGPGAPRRP